MEPKYESKSGQSLRRYTQLHPENVVWTPESGWIDNNDVADNAPED